MQVVKAMIAEKKHMGRPTLGTIYTRTGRAFFDRDTESEVLRRMNEDLVRRIILRTITPICCS